MTLQKKVIKGKKEKKKGGEADFSKVPFLAT